MPELPANIFKIQTANHISPLGLSRFPANHYQIGNDITQPDAILVRSFNLLNADIPLSVKAIGRAGAGTNNIPVQTMNSRGVPVFNTPGANANAVKELVLASLFMAARNIVPALEFVKSLQGDDATLNTRAEDGKKRYSGIELPGRTIGIVGLGEIGRLVANASLKLGMKVIGFDPKITVDSAWSLSAEVKKANSLEDLLRRSDFISIHVPLLDTTRHMIDDKNKIRYYVCDFPSEKLHHRESVIILPHLGASTQEAEENCAVMVVDQLIDYLQNGNITNTVNFPDTQMERESPYRVAVANANVPNILGQISTSMAKAGLNIHTMINKSRGEMAYTLVDVDSPIPSCNSMFLHYA